MGGRMKKAKYMLRIICVIAIGLLLIGCSENIENTEMVDEGECAHVVMTFPYIKTTRMGHLDQIAQAVNAYAREKIGVEVEFLPVDAMESRETYPLWITQGKSIDLMLLNYEDITSYVEQSMILPLDDYLETEGKDIEKLSEEREDILSGGTIHEKKYGIGIPTTLHGHSGGLWIPERYLKEVDFQYEDEHIYSFEEIDKLLASMKKKHPDQYPLGITTQSYDFSVSMFFLNGYESAGSDINTGVIMSDEGELQVVDYYETEAYQNWIHQIRDWYLKGYIYPDAAVTTASNVDLLKAGIIMSIPQNGTPYFYTDEEIGQKMVCLQMTPIQYGPANSKGMFWIIPTTTENAEAAMKFLNLMFSDTYIVNLLECGIEGVDYEKIGENVVTYPEGKNQESIEFFNPIGAFGDQRLRYSYESDEQMQKILAYSNRAKGVGFEFSGFSFDTSPISMEMEQIEDVLDQYLDVLETGCVDSEVVYPEFVEKLHAAGMQKVLKEKQRQLDSFEAKK